MDTAIAYRYITSNKEILSGEPIIKGTRTSVRTIVETWRRGVPHLFSLSQLSQYAVANIQNY